MDGLKHQVLTLQAVYEKAPIKSFQLQCAELL